ESEPEVDGLLACVTLFWQMLEGTECLPKIPHGLAMGRPRHDLLSRLPTVPQRLVPHFAPQGMMREPFHLLDDSVTRSLFQRLDNAGMEHPPSLLQETAISHLVRQGMLEGVLTLREQPDLIEKLRRLEMGQAALHSVFRHLGNGLQQG